MENFWSDAGYAAGYTNCPSMAAAAADYLSDRNRPFDQFWLKRIGRPMLT